MKRTETIRVTWTDDPDEIEVLCDELYDDRMYMPNGQLRKWYRQPWNVDNITYVHLGDDILGVLVVFNRPEYPTESGTWVPPKMRRQHIGTLLYREHRLNNFRRQMWYCRWNHRSRKFYDSVSAPLSKIDEL